MRDLPILFSGPMVRAIPLGKTQTRRVVKLLHSSGLASQSVREIEPGVWHIDGQVIRCPYGVPGDRLWVKETHHILDMRPAVADLAYATAPDGPFPVAVTYAADDTERHLTIEQGQWRSSFDNDQSRWRSSIHMPRWASRIALEVVSVRVQRVEDITEADAIAEGCVMDPVDPWPKEQVVDGVTCGWDNAVDWFLDLFYGINKRAPEGSNPWVWAIEFKQIGGQA